MDSARLVPLKKSVPRIDSLTDSLVFNQFIIVFDTCIDVPVPGREGGGFTLLHKNKVGSTLPITLAVGTSQFGWWPIDESRYPYDLLNFRKNRPFPKMVLWNISNLSV